MSDLKTKFKDKQVLQYLVFQVMLEQCQQGVQSCLNYSFVAFTSTCILCRNSQIKDPVLSVFAMFLFDIYTM